MNEYDEYEGEEVEEATDKDVDGLIECAVKYVELMTSGRQHEAKTSVFPLLREAVKPFIDEE